MGQREIDREMRNLEKGEKKLMADIKKAAQKGDNANAKQLAKQLVRTRGTMGKLRQTSGQLGAIGNRAGSMNATMAMTSALESGTKVMGEMNKQMDPIAQQKLAQQFAVENDKAQMQDEMFSDLFDSMMEEGEEEEGDA